MFRVALVILNMKQIYLLRTLPDGQRQVSWRVWVLIFVLPVLFIGTAVGLAVLSNKIVSEYQRATGEVVRVYDWPGYTPWDGETTDYSPVFRYEFRKGEMTEASTGQSSPNWNYEIGSHHEILFDPTQKIDVKQNSFEQLWALPTILGTIGGIFLIPALIAVLLVFRWKRREVRQVAPDRNAVNDRPEGNDT